jgi:uncharacterized protein (TIGR02001 family)
MKMKTLLTTIMATGLAAGASLASADGHEMGGWSTSANAALTSDYKFRGISQSDEDPAIQGGFDLAHESGFYIGTWASSVDFGGNGFGSIELDVYAGFGGDIGDTDFSYDVGVLYYAYPGDDLEGPGPGEGDYLEFYGSVAWKDLTVGVAYSDDYYLESDEFFYVYADYSFALPADISLDLHVGYNSLEEDGGFLSSDEDGYTDFSVGLTKSFMAVDFTLAYVGTDLDDDDYFDTDLADPVAVFTISKSM